LGVFLGLIPGTEWILFGVVYDAQKGPLPANWPKCETYAESSPSGGDSFHILGTYKGKPYEAKKGKAVEIYTTARYFTLTGERINGASILPPEPKPFYAAVGHPDPQSPREQAAASSVKVSPVKESDL